jgi:hypothetical protein
MNSILQYSVKKIVTALLLAVLSILSCEKFEEINTDHNSTLVASASMLCTEVILDFVKFQGRDAKVFISANALSKYVGYVKEGQMNTQYNKLGGDNFDDMTILPNIAKLEQYAEGLPEEYSYKGVAKFARAVKFYVHTMRLGDIPYTETGLGISGFFKPEYDLQQDVLLGILIELDEANQYFARGKTFTGDPTPYNGDPLLWRKAVNAFTLKVLMNLSNKVDHSSFDIKNRFASLASDKNVLLDNRTTYFGIEYSAKNKHPLYDQTAFFAANTIISSLLTDNLKQLNDRRLFFYAEPSELKLLTYSDSDTQAYVGADITKKYQELSEYHDTGFYSTLNRRYVLDYDCEPKRIITYAEQQLILSEAVIRHWIPGSAAEYYEEGVRSALSYFIRFDSEFDHGMPINDDYINNYFTGEAAFKSTPDEQLKQIWMQRYILNFMQESLSAYFEYRRNKYPEFPVNPETSLNENNTSAVPMRWLYPQSEFDFNYENLQQAIQRQYDGWDEINKMMWLLQ